LRRHLLRPRLIVLRLRLVLRLMLRLVLLRLIVLGLIVLGLMLLRLMVLLLARVKRLRLARRERLANLRLVVVVVVIVGEIVAVAHAAAGLLLVKRLTLAKLFLGGCNQTEIMLGMLIIIFRRNRISGTLRVAGELEIFLGDVRRRSANFHVLPVGLVHPRQWILVMVTTLIAIATAHAFVVLTVSHGLLFRQPR